MKFKYYFHEKLIDGNSKYKYLTSVECNSEINFYLRQIIKINHNVCTFSIIEISPMKISSYEIEITITVMDANKVERIKET